MTRMLAVFSLLGLAAVTPALAAPHGSVPPESFLNYHAATVHELSQEVTLDPAVRARLSRHFHVTPAQMKTYVSKNLVLTHLKSTGSYRVACVRADGSEYWVQERLPAGTPIFASRATGQPILKLACGNPMVGTLPAVTQVSDNQTLYTKPEIAAVPSTEVVPTPAAPLLTSAIAPEYSFTTDALTVPPVVQVADSLQGVSFARAGGGFPLGYLAGVPVVAGILGSRGSGGGSTPSDTPAVPEASTVLSLGLLLAGTGVVLLRRKRPALD